MDERMDGERSASLRHRRGRHARPARQSFVSVRYESDAPCTRGRRRADTDALCGHGGCGRLEPRAPGRTRRGLLARRRAALSSLLAALVLVCIGGCAAEAPQPPHTTVLTYASPYGPGHPFSRADIQWMKWIEQESDGRLRIEPYWSGSLLSSEHSLIELRHGVADIGLITPIYARGGAHLQRTQRSEERRVGQE